MTKKSVASHVTMNTLYIFAIEPLKSSLKSANLMRKIILFYLQNIKIKLFKNFLDDNNDFLYIIKTPSSSSSDYYYYYLLMIKLFVDFFSFD